MTTPVIDSPPARGTRPYLVSVVITTRNRSQLLREAIQSVLDIKNPAFNLEIIVVDDGSTDGTLEVLADYPVTLIKTTGIGMAKARNAGLHAAQGDFVTLLDDDDVWLPNNIAPHIELFERHPEFGAVHAQAQLANYDKTPFGDPVPAGPLPSGWIFEELLQYWPQVGTILTRTSVAREAGDMDPTLTGDTDWDWLLRVARRYPIGRIEQPVMLFRQRNKAEEELAWRRFPAMVKIFKRHTRDLSALKQLKLRPILWRHRGWWASQFLNFARMHVAEGNQRRAYRSLYYAFRCSPPHALINCVRDWPLKQPKIDASATMG